MRQIAKRFEQGDSVVLRYVLSDGRIEICWPCRVVQDTNELVVLYVAKGTTYKAGPKRPAAAKRVVPSPPIPAHEYVWRVDALRLMLPDRPHSVSLFWDDSEG